MLRNLRSLHSLTDQLIIIECETLDDEKSESNRLLGSFVTLNVLDLGCTPRFKRNRFSLLNKHGKSLSVDLRGLEKC